MAEEKKGVLSRIANKVFSLETLFVTVPLALATGYVGNMIGDFAFFDIIHGTEGLNPEAVKWKMLMNELSTPVHNIAGLTGSGGFLQSAFMGSVFNFFGIEYDVTDGYNFGDVEIEEHITDVAKTAKEAVSIPSSGELPSLKLPIPGQ